MEKFKLLLRGFGSTVFFTSILLLCAGRFSYLPAWVYFITTLVTTVITFLVMQKNSTLLKERANAGQGAAWDKIILGTSAIFFLAAIIVAGLDAGRFGWSAPYPLSISITGALITIAGHSIFLMAQKQNQFFSAAYRIQSERGHAVCDTGIYRLVRHPGYLGMSISLIGFPFLSCSVWSSLPIGAAIVLLIVRTILEDKALSKDLTGYLDYAKRVPKKMIPFIW